MENYIHGTEGTAFVHTIKRFQNLAVTKRFAVIWGLEKENSRSKSLLLPKLEIS